MLVFIFTFIRKFLVFWEEVVNLKIKYKYELNKVSLLDISF